jgi:two-component system C4-dicarboxylate transport response regulator DctD
LGKALALKDLEQVSQTDESLSLQEKVSYFEQSLIEEALSQSQGSIKEAMALLQLPRKTLYDKMAKYGLTRTMFTESE